MGDMMSEPRFIPLEAGPPLSPEASRERARAFYDRMRRRRTVRTFDERPIPDGVLEACLRTAGTAPSGAHLQPWHFVVVRDPEQKRRVREAAESEERAFYEHRAPAEWLEALAALGTDATKPYLETAPALVVVFGVRWGVKADGTRRKHYYVDESVGLACGLLIAALHQAGLATLTHTPSPMGFLRNVLDRPENERPFLILVVGYPAPGTLVPDLERKALGEIATFHDGPTAP